jgi:hypothetical protein
MTKDELIKEFDKDNNYTDEIPQEMKNILCHLVENKDWDGLTNFMRIGVNLTRRECAGRAEQYIIQREKALLDDIEKPLIDYKVINQETFDPNYFRSDACVQEALRTINSIRGEK